MEQLEVLSSVGRRAGVTVLRVKGPFTLGTMFRFQEAARAAGVTHLVLDLTGVTRIDSGALGALLSQWAHSRRNGWALAVAGMSERVRSIFEITRTDSLLPIFADVEKAEAAMRITEPRP